MTMLYKYLQKVSYIDINEYFNINVRLLTYQHVNTNLYIYKNLTLKLIAVVTYI